MYKKQKSIYYLKKVSEGIGLSIIVIIIFFIYKKDKIPGKILLYETLPYTNIQNDVSMLFKLDSNKVETIENKTVETFLTSNNIEEEKNTDIKENTNIEENISIQDNNVFSNEIVGTYNVIYQEDENHFDNDVPEIDTNLTTQDVEQLNDLEFLKSKMYVESAGTVITKDDFDINEFLETNLKINNENSEPKILIFHTHIHEMFLDSDAKNLSEGIMGVGEKLAKVLTDKYGISVLHHKGEYDLNNGTVSVTGSYEKIEKPIAQILKENPSIEVIIDLHRDGFNNPETKVLTEIDGKKTAQIMFVNGMTKRLEEGVLKSFTTLPNPYLSTNLAFSFNMQLTSNSMYPNFARRIYLKPYRYSLNMLPKSLLIEVGANTNTKEEVSNSVEPLADIIAKVVL